MPDVWSEITEALRCEMPALRAQSVSGACGLCFALLCLGARTRTAAGQRFQRAAFPSEEFRFQKLLLAPGRCQEH
eukprot:3331654-Alexandrium_andersonii.AAC.1